MLRVREINDAEELVGYRLAWNALLLQTRNSSFFQCLEWFQTYWHHFGCYQRLRAILVFEDDRPMGFVPLVVRTESTRVGPLRVLTYPLHDWGTFYGPIGPAPSAALWVALQHVRRTPRDWDLLDLRWVDMEGCDFGRTPAAMRLAGFYPHRQAWNRAAILELRGTWEDYWSSRPGHWRREVGRLMRRALKQGDVALVRYRPKGAACDDGEPRWDLYDACVDIARQSWQGISSTGTTLCHASVDRYLRDTHEAAARAGGVDMNLLVLDGRPIAFAYHYRYQGHLYGLRRGYDPNCAELRPGIILQRMLVEDSFRRGDRVFDMGVGSLESKRPWQTHLATSYRYTHFPWSSPRTQLLRFKRWMQSRLHGPRDLACA